MVEVGRHLLAPHAGCNVTPRTRMHTVRQDRGQKGGFLTMPKHLPRTASRADVELLLAQLNPRSLIGLRDRALLEVMYRCGLRVAEALALRPVNLKPANPQGNGQSHCGYVEVRNGKGGRDRTVPMDSRLSGWLGQWLQRRPPSEWVFPVIKGNLGAQMATSTVRILMRRLADKAGLDRKQWSPHVLRHCYASELLEDGFSLVEVRDLLGHTNIAVTSVYLHSRPLQLAEKMAKRGELRLVA
jgi:integrase/recombinase XerD